MARTKPDPPGPPPRPADPTPEPEPGPAPRPGPGRKPVSDAEKAFGERLREARINAGYRTQAAAAAKLDVKQHLISQYEAGERLPPITRLIEIVATLGLNPRDIFPPEWWPGKRPKKKSDGA